MSSVAAFPPLPAPPPWLHTWLASSLSSPLLEQTFLPVSEELGRLLAGHYREEVQESGVLALLGQGFLARHRIGGQGGLESNLERGAATFSRVQEELGRLGQVALEAR